MSVVVTSIPRERAEELCCLTVDIVMRAQRRGVALHELAAALRTTAAIVDVVLQRPGITDEELADMWPLMLEGQLLLAGHNGRPV